LNKRANGEGHQLDTFGGMFGNMLGSLFNFFPNARKFIQAKVEKNAKQKEEQGRSNPPRSIV
jgi:hypothetical protein